MLGNLLEAARRIATREPLSLDTLAAKGVVRHADAADAKNPGPVEAGVMKEALGKFSSAAAAAEPYALDVFLASLTPTPHGAAHTTPPPPTTHTHPPHHPHPPHTHTLDPPRPKKHENAKCVSNDRGGQCEKNAY